MKLDVADGQILSLDSGVIDCPITAEQVTGCPDTGVRPDSVLTNHTDSLGRNFLIPREHWV